MKIRAVQANNRKRAFELHTTRGTFTYPYAKLDLQPDASNRVREVYPEPETGGEAFTYRLESGDEDSIHLDAVLEYNQDPSYLNEVLIHQLTLEALRAVEESGVSKRELTRRLATSASQLYRLLDPGNPRKSVGQILALLHLLGHNVSLVVSTADTKCTGPVVKSRRVRRARSKA